MIADPASNAAYGVSRQGGVLQVSLTPWQNRNYPLARDRRLLHYDLLILDQCAGFGAMSRLDPWGKAAECERAIEVVADPERRVVLSSLRSLWLALGDRQSFFDGPKRASQLSTITQIHTELMSVCRNAMH
jgi:hypothetical protein